MRYVIVIALLCAFVLANAQEYHRIDAHQEVVSDTFYGSYVIDDEFRWLEYTGDNEVTQWTEAQNAMSKKYISRTLSKTNAYNSIDKYASIRYDSPRKMGDYYFEYAYYDNLGVPGLYYRTNLKYRSELLVDPLSISRKDKISLKGHYVSKDSRLLAYQFGRNGTDWAEVKVLSINNGKDLDDHLVGLKFSSIEWLGDGFFYSTYTQADKFGATLGQRVFYHAIGTVQEDDKLIFERKKNPTLEFEFLTTSDERYFVLTEINEAKGMINIFYIDYDSDQKGLRPLMMKFPGSVEILDNHGGKFIATTTYNSDNVSIVEIDPADPYKWRTVVPQFSEALLLRAVPFDDRIVTVYQSNQQPTITVFDYDGQVLHNLQMPPGTSIRGLSGEKSDEEVLFDFNSYIVPPVVYEFNIRTFERHLTEQTKVTFDVGQFTIDDVEYTSFDGVKVPMILVHKKDLELNGSNPTILKAYGGFGVVASPSFDAAIIHFISNGGVFAFANIRGGGDKGVPWVKGGRGLNKQNSFSDFISAAEYLIDKKYTNPSKLATTGASNGGLVVAAAAIQRPDLFQAVVSVVAPLDMIRFEKFTIGHFHLDEYGTVQDSLSFTKLMAYSPYNNIKEDVNYPSMLVVTSENDDRVPPFHSYKFVARLQNRKAQQNPVLLHVEKNAGHYGASTRAAGIREKANMYGFIMYELGMR